MHQNKHLLTLICSLRWIGLGGSLCLNVGYPQHNTAAAAAAAAAGAGAKNRNLEDSSPVSPVNEAREASKWASSAHCQCIRCDEVEMILDLVQSLGEWVVHWWWPDEVRNGEHNIVFMWYVCIWHGILGIFQLFFPTLINNMYFTIYITVKIVFPMNDNHGWFGPLKVHAWNCAAVIPDHFTAPE